MNFIYSTFSQPNRCRMAVLTKAQEQRVLPQESGIIFSRQLFPMGLSVPNNRPDYTVLLKAFGMSEFLLGLVLAGVGLGMACVAFVYELLKWKGRGSRETLGK